MIKIDNEKVLLLHKLLIEETGGEANLRDINLHDSSIEQIYQTFDGEELYKTKEEKAARFAFTLISNYAFVDGNKRIGMYIMLIFLEANGVKVNFSNQEIVNIGMRIARNEMGYEDILRKKKEHENK